MSELISEGYQLSSVPALESKFNEGDNGELRLYLSEPLSTYAIERLENDIKSQGVTLTSPIIQEARILVIRFKKEIFPLLIIVGAVGAIGAGLLGWQIFKSTQLGVPLWVWLVGGSALLYILLRKPVRQAGGLAIQAGKVYVGKKLVSNPRRY